MLIATFVLSLVVLTFFGLSVLSLLTGKGEGLLYAAFLAVPFAVVLAILNVIYYAST